MAVKHGKDSKVTLNGSTVCVTSWSVDTSIEEVDNTDTCSGGFTTTIAGKKNATFTFTVNYDDTYQETTGVLAAVEEGDTVSLEFFAENVDTVPWFDMPTARINTISASADVNSLVTVVYSGSSNGEYDTKGEVTT